MNTIAQDYTTISEATKMLGYSSRDSVDRLLKQGKIGYEEIAGGTTSMIRIISIKDIKAFRRG